jgi:hypothetical protein
MDIEEQRGGYRAVRGGSRGESQEAGKHYPRHLPHAFWVDASALCNQK